MIFDKKCNKLEVIIVLIELTSTVLSLKFTSI